MPKLSSVIEQVSGAFRMVKGKDVDITDSTALSSGEDADIILVDESAAGTQASTKKMTLLNLFNYIATKVYTGASAESAGTAGVVPAPSVGDQASKFLKADGRWVVPPDTTTNTQLSTEAVQDIVGGMLSGTETRIGVAYDDTNGRINFVVDDMTANDNTQLTSENVQDIVGGMLVGTETRIGVTYDDTNGRINFVVDDMTANDNTQLTTESVQDIIGAMFSSNTETRVSATYVDGGVGAGKINIAVDDMTANDNTQNTTTLSFVDSSNDILLRNATGGAGSGNQDIKLVAGTNITLTHTDANNVTIAASSGGDGDITGVTIQTDSGSGSKATDTSGSADFSLLGSSGVGITNSGTTITAVAVPGEIDHDSLNNFVPNEHLDWTSDQGSTNIHSGNYINTTYSVQDGQLSQNNFTNADHTKLNNIEGNADVTDTANVTSSGALMDSEVTNLSQVKAFDSSDYATAAQGSKADSAQQPPSEGAFANGDKTRLDAIEDSADVTDAANVESAGALMDSELTSIADVKALDQSVVSGASPTFGTANLTDASNKRLMTDAQETKLDSVASSSNNYVHPNHSGEVTSTADGATVIANNVVDEANLKVSNNAVNGYALIARSNESGGLKWESVSSGGSSVPSSDVYNSTLKILPTQFMGNDDVSLERTVIEDDVRGKLGVRVTNASQEIFANVSIPQGLKVTHYRVYASATLATILYGVTYTDGAASTVGNGNSGAAIALRANYDSSETNYVSLKVTTTATNQIIYGATLTLATI